MKGMMKVLYTLVVAVMQVSVAMPVFAIGSINPTQNPNGLDWTTINNVLGLIQVLGIVLAVAILMIMGIKYMMGSVEEKAEYKKTIIPYVVGLVLVIAAVTIVTVIKSTAGSVVTTK